MSLFLEFVHVSFVCPVLKPKLHTSFFILFFHLFLQCVCYLKLFDPFSGSLPNLDSTPINSLYFVFRCLLPKVPFFSFYPLSKFKIVTSPFLLFLQPSGFNNVKNEMFRVQVFFSFLFLSPVCSMFFFMHPVAPADCFKVPGGRPRPVSGASELYLY